MTSIVKHCKAYLNDENFEPAYEQFTSNEVLNYIRSTRVIMIEKIL